MIIVTGAAGFIGSSVVWYLNSIGKKDIIISDKLRNEDKWLNIRKRNYLDWVDRDELFSFIESHSSKINTIIHMGACSATTEKDGDFLMKNNYEYTKKLWDYSVKYDINFIYASSAATYGGGENGYNDKESIEPLLPLNKYGYSKQIFDIWALKQEKTPKKWAGLKFFNVYGPNEYHKGRMASVVYHAYNQVLSNREVKLFKSYKKGYEDGFQLRDFVYVKDVVKIINFFRENKDYENGIYNIGTGVADSFYNLAKYTMESMGKVPNISFIDMPEDIREKYQYFTEAKMEKLRKNGYREKLFSLEDGIRDYVVNYLLKEDKYL
ncbi:MAG: ADP-glyceromanno-heptose 6-epimerase [Fusobacteria bacterium]|nr:ADP-glyceromanno-heptose 6-epimerase [Fusobacteriota bacterium]